MLVDEFGAANTAWLLALAAGCANPCVAARPGTTLAKFGGTRPPGTVSALGFTVPTVTVRGATP